MENGFESGFSNTETEVTRFLFGKEVEHKIIVHKKAVHSCEEVSKERSIALGSVLKCILVVDKARKYAMFCIPGDTTLDLDKAREFLNSSRLSFATREETEVVTGKKSGTLNPFFHQVKVPVIFDSSIREKEIMDVSSGSPNIGVQLHQKVLVMLVNPVFSNVAVKKSSAHQQIDAHTDNSETYQLSDKKVGVVK